MFLFHNVAFLGCFQYVIYWKKCWKYTKLHPDKDTAFIYSLFQKELKIMYLTVFCMCVYLYLFFCLKLFIPVTHTLTHGALYSVHLGAGFPVPGLADPTMGINTEGLQPLSSLEILDCRMESVHLHTNTTALSVLHPLPNPQFRHSHLQFWLCSPSGSVLLFLHVFPYLPQRKDIIF